MNEAYRKLSYIMTKYQVDRTTIYRWIKERGMPAIQLPNNRWIFDEDKVENWIKEKGKEV